MATNKLLWSSKLIGVFFIMLVCTLSANAQFLRTSYFMEGTHYRQQLNPALSPPDTSSHRSEERRVGKECRSRWSPYH